MYYLLHFYVYRQAQYILQQPKLQTWSLFPMRTGPGISVQILISVEEPELLDCFYCVKQSAFPYSEHYRGLFKLASISQLSAS